MGQSLRVLVACEFSGVVRRAFAARGHDTWSCDLLPAEAARPVVGFPKYMVTQDGQVWSLWRRRPFAMRPRPHKAGYKIVTLRDGNGSGITTTIHRLIASVFHPNPDNLPCVRHLDGDKANNAAANLAWGTYADNESDKVPLGRRRYGTSKMKMNRAAREEAKKMFKNGCCRSEIAAHFGVHRSTVSRLLTGKTWESRKWPMAEQAALR